MKKKMICLLGLILLSQSYSFVFAKAVPISNGVKIAIKKYKAGNYTGCLQDCEAIVQKTPSALAYYYMAMSYAQAGKQNEAIANYSKALSMKPSAKLSEYATMGKRCLETPEQCVPSAPSQTPDEVDKFINSSPDGLSDTVKKDFQQKQLNNIKNEINKDKELDDYSFQKLNENTNNSNNKIAKGPSEEDIQKALKVLSEARVNPYSATGMMNTNENVYNQSVNNPDLMQVNALLGQNNQNQNSNNAMLDALPFMLSQNKDGKSNYSPQMLQSIIMSSMMGNLNYNVDTSKE